MVELSNTAKGYSSIIGKILENKNYRKFFKSKAM